MSTENWFQFKSSFSQKKWAFWLMLTLTILLIIALIFFVSYENHVQQIKKFETPLEFSPEQWIEEPSHRYQMLESLWHQYDGFEGMKRDEIRDLLGEPSYVSTDSDSSHDFYLVRSGKLLGPGTFLSIRYDETGIAIGFGLTEMD